jgi:hypothetical protein
MDSQSILEHAVAHLCGSLSSYVMDWMDTDESLEDMEVNLTNFRPVIHLAVIHDQDGGQYHTASLTEAGLIERIYEYVERNWGMPKNIPFDKQQAIAQYFNRNASNPWAHGDELETLTLPLEWTARKIPDITFDPIP